MSAAAACTAQIIVFMWFDKEKEKKKNLRLMEPELGRQH